MRQMTKLAVSKMTFRVIFMDDTEHAQVGAPDCPVIIDAGYTNENIRKCDCSVELRTFAISAEDGHPCGEQGKCPVRTYLQLHSS